jgi:DNA invertase Pin-like site-specific DNA recombinase
MRVGYARVSTDDQDLSLQMDALQQAGCEKIITDEVSGKHTERPGLQQLQDQILREGDTLVIWRLDRLGRSTKNLIEWMTYLQERGIELQSLHEQVDTSTSTGQLVFHIFAALAEFERNLIRERTQAGMRAARARGRQGGRPKKLSQSKQDLAFKLYQEQKHSVGEICDMVGVSKPTLYKYLKKR